MKILYQLRSALALGFFVTAVQAAEDLEAKHLLQKAVGYYEVQGDASFAAFSRQGEFIDGDHYVFVVDTKGTMLASGGSSAVLIGRDVTNALEPELRGRFQEALETPDSEVHSAEYRWMNSRNARVEVRRVYFQRVGDRILAVGSNLPRASPQQAEQLLDKAVKSVSEDPKGSLAAINSLSPSFREDDLYIFVIDMTTGRYLAHGYNLRLLGVDFKTIKDPDGKPVGIPILAMMKDKDKGGYEYRWKNPVTGQVEQKFALLRKTGNMLVAVGYYKKTE